MSEICFLCDLWRAHTWNLPRMRSRDDLVVADFPRVMTYVHVYYQLSTAFMYSQTPFSNKISLHALITTPRLCPSFLNSIPSRCNHHFRDFIMRVPTWCLFFVWIFNHLSNFLVKSITAVLKTSLCPKLVVFAYNVWPWFRFRILVLLCNFYQQTFICYFYLSMSECHYQPKDYHTFLINI